MLKDYLKYRRKEIGLVIGFGVIFAISFALYHLPMEAVAYPFILCFVFALGGMVIDFLQMKKVMEALKRCEGMEAAYMDSIPETKDPLEKEYQELIEVLKEEVRRTNTEHEEHDQKMMEYFSVWVHQIKTPIAAMRLALQGEDSELARNLSSEVMRTEQYVEMVLAYFRMGGESTDYVIRKVHMDELIRQSVKKFAGLFIRKKLGLSYEGCQKEILTDEKWMAFVVEQILSNAIKYTNSGTISIYLRDENTLCIEDTGMGIAPEDLPRVFEWGYTGYNGRRDKKASGIGLYLCKRICDNLHHTLQIESVPEEGTRVLIGLNRYDLKPE